MKTKINKNKIVPINIRLYNIVIIIINYQLKFIYMIILNIFNLNLTFYFLF